MNNDKIELLDICFFVFSRVIILILSVIGYENERFSVLSSYLFYLYFLFFSIDLIIYVLSLQESNHKAYFIKNPEIYTFQIIKSVCCLFLKEKSSMFQCELYYSLVIWAILFYRNIPYIQTYNSENQFWKSYLLLKRKNRYWDRKKLKYNKAVIRKNVLYCISFILFLSILGFEYKNHFALFFYILFVTIVFPALTIYSYTILDLTTIIPRCRFEFFIREFANFRVHFISWIIPYLAMLFYLNNSSLLFSFFLLGVFCYSIIFEILTNWYIIGEFKIKEIVSLLFKILTCVIVYYFMNYFFTLFDSKFYEAIQASIPTVVIPIISAVFIFNFSATIYLLQENYHRFNSIFLLKKVLNPFGLIVTVIMPAIFAILILLNIIPTVEWKICFSIVAMEYCLMSSLYLLYMFRFYLDARKVFLYIIGNTTPRIILDYKDQYYEDAENEISTLKNIICHSISKSDAIVQENCYPLFFSWIKQNVDFIHSQSTFVPEIENNGFRKMMFDINESFTDKTKLQVKRNYVEYIYRLFLEIKLSDLRKYSLFYDTLADFAIKSISNKKDNSDSINLAINAIGYKIPNYLGEIKINENERIFVRGSSDYILFEDIVFKNLKRVYEAINKFGSPILKQNVFSCLNLSYIFKNFDKCDKDIIWTMAHVTCLSDFLDMMNNFVMSNADDEIIIRHFIFEYVTLGYIFKNVKMESKENRYMFNSFFNHLSIFFTFIINNDFELNELDFEVFYQPCWDLTENKEIIINYLNLFIYFIGRYFDRCRLKQLSDKSKENIYRIWHRTEQLFDIWSRNEINSKDLSTYWGDKQEKVWNEYKDLLSGYEAFLQKEKEMAYNWQKVMKDF